MTRLYLYLKVHATRVFRVSFNFLLHYCGHRSHRDHTAFIDAWHVHKPITRMNIPRNHIHSPVLASRRTCYTIYISESKKLRCSSTILSTCLSAYISSTKGRELLKVEISFILGEWIECTYRTISYCGFLLPTHSLSLCSIGSRQKGC